MLTRTLIYGLAASSIVFLASYVGMVSLSQYLLVGIASFTIGNCVAESGKGLKLGLDPWIAVLIALAISTLVAFVLGALGSRTTGIYFLMLTLTYAVIGYYVFGQVTSISGFGGITGVNPPDFFNTHPVRLYYAVLVLSVIAYLGFRTLRRTPFGLALEGIRDDPMRMSSLGFNVPIHRTLGLHPGRVRRRSRRGDQHLVERPDRPQLGEHRGFPGPVHHRRDRRDQPSRRRLARRLRVRHRQQLHAFASARRPHRDHRGPLQHGRRRRRADHRRRLAERADGHDHRFRRSPAPGRSRDASPTPTLSTTTMEEST